MGDQVSMRLRNTASEIWARNLVKAKGDKDKGLLARVLWEGECVSYPFLWLNGHYRFAKLGAAVFPDLSVYVE